MTNANAQETTAPAWRGVFFQRDREICHDANSSEWKDLAWRELYPCPLRRANLDATGSAQTGIKPVNGGISQLRQWQEVVFTCKFKPEPRLKSDLREICLSAYNSRLSRICYRNEGVTGSQPAVIRSQRIVYWHFAITGEINGSYSHGARWREESSFL